MAEKRQDELNALMAQAKELVVSLGRLKEEGETMASARKEMEQVNKGLVQLISDTQALAKETHDIVSTTKKIGAPEILKSIQSTKVLIGVGFGVVVIVQVITRFVAFAS